MLPTATEAPVAALPTATLPPLPVTATPDPNLAPAPTLAPPPVVLAVAPTATPIGITGYLGQVDTNPGTNLKIREYPREDAKTLALAPSGAVLDIVGIKGPAQVPNEATPTATATLSPEGLTIDQLWVFVIWRTDDGGQISGWTKPLYLITTDPRGHRLTKIEDFLLLNQVPENEFGEIATGLATPIPTRDLRPRARVARVNEGTNLQIRRLPDIEGESLALVPNGVEMIAIERTDVASRGGLVGEPESLTWVRVQLETDTGTVTGWVNSQYVDLYLVGRPDQARRPARSGGSDARRGDRQRDARLAAARAWPDGHCGPSEPWREPAPAPHARLRWRIVESGPGGRADRHPRSQWRGNLVPDDLRRR